VAGCCECGDEPSGSCTTELLLFARNFISQSLLAGQTVIKRHTFGFHVANNKSKKWKEERVQYRTQIQMFKMQN
jgi:hypothetical protein